MSHGVRHITALFKHDWEDEFAYGMECICGTAGPTQPASIEKGKPPEWDAIDGWNQNNPAPENQDEA